MVTKYECGKEAADKTQQGHQTVYDETNIDVLGDLAKSMTAADDKINEGIDLAVKNKTLRKILKNKTVKTAVSAAVATTGFVVWRGGMALGGDAGAAFAAAGTTGILFGSMGVLHNVSNMKMVKALYHGFKNGVKTTADELSPEAKKIKDKVEHFTTALTKKDVPMTVRHFDRQTGEMTEIKLPVKATPLSQRVINAARSVRGGK